MEDLVLKYNRLDRYSRQLVLDFIDMLLKRGNAEPVASMVTDVKTAAYEKKQKQPFEEPKFELPEAPFDHEEFKKRLLEVSVWSKEDIKQMEANIEAFKNWKLEEW